MDHRFGRRRAAVAAVLVALTLLAGGCGGAAAEGTAAGSRECAPFRSYQGHAGTSVRMYSSVRGADAVNLREAWRRFSDCTGIRIVFEGDADFEAQIQTRLDAHDGLDLAIFPQPGLMARFVAAGVLKPAPKATRTAAERGWSEDWLSYGTVNGTFYAAPLSSNVKSFVWYSPKFFSQHNYQIPTTWDELVALTERIAAGGTKPWCAGIESGEATGWPITDWLEDVLLRTQGPEVYDRWVTHQLPFNDPRVGAALDRVGAILKDPRFVNGGHGDVHSIATTTFQNGGMPILSGSCAMHRQASFYAGQWPSGTRLAEDGDVYAFYFPVIDPGRGRPVLGGGEFVAAFSDRPEVQAFQTYLATAEFASARVRLGSWVSANRGVALTAYTSPIDRLSAEILQAPTSVFRFDGSDLMPSAVGAGTFWTGVTEWINGRDTAGTLDAIERSWPT